MILPRVGQIKIGMKNANGYPQSVDYFIPTGKYAGLFTQAYGEKPQTIQIVFPDDDPAKVQTGSVSAIPGSWDHAIRNKMKCNYLER